MDTAREEFFGECHEIIDRVSTALNSIQGALLPASTIDSLYRDIHTLKGSSQLFGFSMIGKTAHAMESTLEPLRKAPDTKLSENFVLALNRCLEFIEQLYSALRGGGTEDKSTPEFLEVLSSLVHAAVEQFGSVETPLPTSLEAGVAESESVNNARLISVKPAPSVPLPTPQSQEAPPIMEQTKNEIAPAAKPEAGTTESTIRVSVELLDRLMNLVGELVLVRNQMLEHSTRQNDVDLLTLGRTLNSVTSDLQSEVMRTRMQPIGSVFAKFQRVVRDIAHTLSKKIEVSITGSETELDKTLLESIKDPLTHIIRNSCDHGIEPPDDRKASGKAEAGHISIRAYHEGGQVVIAVSDDGRGLNTKRILAKAQEKGLVTPEQASHLSEHEICALIFAPGFSTAEAVTAVSGRGVGMDVVKTNIERIGGTVDLENHPGKGMTIRLRIPLTLAIVPAMLVEQRGERFAIPQVKLVQLVRVERDNEASLRVEMLQGKPILRLREKLLPLINLAEIFADQTTAQSEQDLSSRAVINIVVLTSELGEFGLIVDQILDSGDIVVKPLSQFIKTLGIFAGATLMGDGSVALILDVSGLAARVIERAAASTTEASLSDQRASQAASAHSDSQEFLLFSTKGPGRFAVPLCLVQRLEEFPHKAVEYAGGQKVVQYRGTILQILSASEALGFTGSESGPVDVSSNPIQVIVINKGGRNYGIEVTEILDVISLGSAIDDAVRDRPGVMGTTVHENGVIVVVDALFLIEKAFQAPLAQSKAAATGPKRLKILLAEDTPFFRRHITRFLEKSGHSVTQAEDGSQALAILSKAAAGEFDLVLSDIEMPNLDGFALARAVRKLPSLAKIPMVAVTSRFHQRDQDEGKSAGFDRYLEKLNEETLLSEIKGLVA